MLLEQQRIAATPVVEGICRSFATSTCRASSDACAAPRGAAPPLARVDLSAAAAPAAAPPAAAPRPPVLADAARGVPHDDEMRRLSLALRERLERKAYLLRNNAREERRPPIPA